MAKIKQSSCYLRHFRILTSTMENHHNYNNNDADEVENENTGNVCTSKVNR